MHSINKNLERLPLLTTSSQTVSGLELGTYSGKAQDLSFTKVKTRAGGHINLAVGNLIVNISRVGRDDL